MRTINIINLTPHDVALMFPNSTKIKHIFPKLDRAPRCDVHTEIEETVLLEGSEVTIPLSYTKYRKTLELPPSKPYTKYIVSDVIAKMMIHDRDDLLICNGLVRDPKTGKVLGCRSLGRI